MLNILISVIVPVYKIEEALLRQCLQSLIEQTELLAEFIVVDDGSPDDCGKIIDDFSSRDNRIKAVHVQKGGVSTARNIGIERASGKYIMFVDGDDYIEPETCKNLLHAIEVIDSDLLLFMHQPTSTHKEPFLNDTSLQLLPEEETSNVRMGIIARNDYIAGFSLGASWGKVFRRSIITDNNIKFLSKLKISEDRLFVYDYLEHTKSIALYRYKGYHYVFRKDSACHGYNEDILQCLNLTEKEFEKRRESVPENEIEKYKTALNSMYLAHIYDTLRLYIFNKRNIKSYHEKCKELKHLLSQQNYAEALKNSNLKALKGKRKKLTILATRCHLYRLVYMLVVL